MSSQFHSGAQLGAPGARHNGAVELKQSLRASVRVRPGEPPHHPATSLEDLDLEKDPAFSANPFPRRFPATCCIRHDAGADLGASLVVVSLGPPSHTRMGNAALPLTDAAIRSADVREKEYKLFDSDGLFLLVLPTGARYWRMKYRFAGSEKKLAFGVYPKVSLKEARQRCDQARRDLRDGIDPGIKKKIAKIVACENSFKAVAEEWLELLKNPPKNPKGKQQKAPLAEGTLEHKRSWLDDYILPHIGSRPINAISAPEILNLCRRVERMGIVETAHRVRSTCSRVFRYGIATSRCERDPAADIIGALTPVVVTHHAALTEPRSVGTFLRTTHEYHGELVTRLALRILPLVFLRSSELRWAEWWEIDWEEEIWRLPARRLNGRGMKMKEAHLVPLSRQALELLRELHMHTGQRRFMFPQLRKEERPLSENTINCAYRRMGYSVDEVTGHGWRTTARTLLREIGWAPDTIRVQLAHVNPDDVDEAYDRAKLLSERRKMLQAWADYLDCLRGGNVVAFAKSA